jgi:magnesium chelatase family protein
MMAKRLPGILPSMTYEEKLEVTQIYSIAGELSEGGGIVERRPFRAPHHTVSAAALVGGGRRPRPGEVSLAHHGVLFLDELPEFSRYAAEMLRQPLEDEKVTLTRVTGAYTYPSKCMLVISMNPCPCGYFGSLTQECTCTPGQIQKYLTKLSSPLLDRIDLQLEVFPVAYNELAGNQKNKSSSQMRREVEQARTIQLERYKKEGILYNSQLNAGQTDKYCKLDPKSKGLLESAFRKLSLSARAYMRIIKLSRTIADLEGRGEIQAADIAEAIQYRSLDKKYRSF